MKLQSGNTAFTIEIDRRFNIEVQQVLDILQTCIDAFTRPSTKMVLIFTIGGVYNRITALSTMMFRQALPEISLQQS